MRWWLSYAAEKFLGAVIVEAAGFPEAVGVVNSLGVNPGGEVRGFQIPSDAPEVADEWMNRLLSLEDVKNLDRAGGGTGEAVNIITGEVK